MPDYLLLELFRQEVEAQVVSLKQHLTLIQQHPQSAAHREQAAQALTTIAGLAEMVELPAVVLLTEALHTRLAALPPGTELAPGDRDRLVAAADWLIEMSHLNVADQEIWLAHHQPAIAALQIPASTPSANPPHSNQALPSQEFSASEVSPPVSRDRPALPLVDAQMMDLFRLEVEEQARVLNDGLITLEMDATTQPLEALMRAAHSIKGAARIVGLDAAVSLAHTMEDCFVAAQHQTLTLTASLIDQLLQAVDLLQHLSQVSDRDLPVWLTQHDTAIARLQSLIQSPSLPAPSAPPSLPASSVPPSLPAPPASPAPLPSSQRVVRVSADNLNRIMGLAGESLIEANVLPTLATALKQVREVQTALSEDLEALEQQVRSRLALNPMEQDLFESVRQQEQECCNLLSDRLTELEEFIRRTTNLSQRLYREVITSHMRPFEEGVQNFPRMVRDLARSLNKQVRLDIMGKATSVDRDILAQLEAPITHILRNAIDHGIEMPESRLAAGKPAEGRIRLEAAHRGGMLTLEIADDGAGINRDQLRQAIVARQLGTPDLIARLHDAELMEFLFLPGFSLSSQVTELSGRGVGLDIVKSMVQDVGGTVRITSQPECGTTFHLQLPLTLSVVRTLLVEVAGEAYAFPLSRIGHILSLDPTEILTAENRQYFIQDQQHIGLIPLYQVLDLPPPTATSDRYWVVVLQDQSGFYGLMVDRCLGEKELVLRPFHPRFGKIQDVSAAALMNDGSLVLILDVSDLLRSLNKLLQTTQPAKVGATRSTQSKTAKRVLVVDDSITVREMERKVLQNQGYVVDVAVDGVEGWNALRSYPYDLIISDIDMPRMNGIELIKAIKQHSRLQSIPIIVVSYRDREDDRIQGLEAGANYYLTKNSFHDDTLIRAVTDLIGD
jgi:two-component system sensor histidine kinase and response regulator WspE